MNRAEALKILGLDASASDEDIKKQFRKLAAKKHPDVNKEENAEEEYKKLSSAFEYLKDPKSYHSSSGHWEQHDFSNLNDFINRARASGGMGGMGGMGGFGGFNVNRPIATPPAVRSHVRISFNESVLGCEKKIDIKRHTLCDKCSGIGKEIMNAPCPGCGGTGGKNETFGNGFQRVAVHTQCGQCMGIGKLLKKCDGCNDGFNQEEAELEIQVPGGVQDGWTLRVRGGGNILGRARDDAFVKISVDSDKDMTLEENNVSSKLELTLYEALAGVTKKVRTVKGEKDLKVRAGVRNREKIRLAGYGVPNRGDHFFVLDIKYPKDVSKLMEVLKEEDKEK